MEKTGKLRILHIEDDVADAELVRLALLRSGLDCDIRLATSRSECLAALDGDEFDLVLSDSHGHDILALDILRLVRQRLPHIAFLFVSGSFDDNDPETLKAAGATDCLLKDHLETLVPAIQRALPSRD
jgi:CheY-like chemotaxis protein